MAGSDIQIGWQDFLEIGLRRKKFFFAPLILVLACAAFYMVFAPRVYEAKALIAVQSEKLINPLIQGLAMPTEISDRLNTLREEILSWSNLTRLVEMHHLDEKIHKGNPILLEKLIKDLRKVIKVKMRGNSLIEVSYEGTEQGKVQNVVNSLTDIVIERDTAIREEESNVAVEFIEEELAVYRTKLENSEKTLREFKELYMTQMPVATALNKQLRDLELQLSNLLINNTEQHPRVIEIKRQIDEVRKQRDAEIQRLVAKGVLKDQDPKLQEQLLDMLSAGSAANATDPTAIKARKSYKALVEGIESAEVSMGGSQVAVSPQGGTVVQVNDTLASSLTLSPRQQQELTKLTRDYSVSENIYRGLLEKLERAKITGRLGEDEEGGKFNIIERARYPLRPTKPNLLHVFGIALFAGLALGVGAVVLAEYLDQSIQSAEDVAELLEIPVLGTISTIVTDKDLEDRRNRRKQWFSMGRNLRAVGEFFGRYVGKPVWGRVDRALMRIGL